MCFEAQEVGEDTAYEAFAVLENAKSSQVAHEARQAENLTFSRRVACRL